MGEQMYSHRPIYLKIILICLGKLTTVHLVEWLSRVYSKRQGGLSYTLLKSSLCLLFEKNCQNRLLLKHTTFTVDCRSVHNRVHGHIDNQYYLHSIKSTFSQLSLLSLQLYIIHVTIIPGSLPLFCTSS